MLTDRYVHPEMGRIWSEESKFDAWREVELAAAEVMGGASSAKKPREIGQRPPTPSSASARSSVSQTRRPRPHPGAREAWARRAMDPLRLTSYDWTPPRHADARRDGSILRTSPSVLGAGPAPSTEDGDGGPHARGPLPSR
jgi:hypothetical protein